MARILPFPLRRVRGPAMEPPEGAWPDGSVGETAHYWRETIRRVVPLGVGDYWTVYTLAVNPESDEPAMWRQPIVGWGEVDEVRVTWRYGFGEETLRRRRWRPLVCEQTDALDPSELRPVRVHGANVVAIEVKASREDAPIWFGESAAAVAATDQIVAAWRAEHGDS